MDIRAIAETFVRARRSGRALGEYPGGVLPADLAQAYAIQDTAISLWGQQPAGWKAGLIAADKREPDGDERLIGPVWAESIQRAADDGVEVPVIDGGFAAVEAEFVVRLDATLPPGQWTAESVAGVPYAIFAGIEIAGSPFPAINDLGPAVTASDFGNNAGLVLGGELSRPPESVAVRTTVDGRIVGEGTGAVVPGGFLTSLAQTLTLLGRRGRTAPAGTFVATGAITGVHPVRIGSHAMITFDDQIPLHCRLIAAQPG